MKRVFSAYTERGANSAEHCENRLDVEALLRRLDDRQLAVITLQFREGHTLEEIGGLIGALGRERVRQISAKSLRTMRNPVVSTPESKRKGYRLITDEQEREDLRQARAEARAERRRRQQRKRRQQAIREKHQRQKEAEDSKRYWHERNVKGFDPADGVVQLLRSIACVSDVKFTSPGGRFDRIELQIDGVPVEFSHGARPSLYAQVFSALKPYLSVEEKKQISKWLNH